MVALSIPASYTSHGTRHCVINVGQSVPPLFTCTLGAYSKTKVYQCIYALIDTHRHRLCVHCTCHCSTVRRISQIFYRKKKGYCSAHFVGSRRKPQQHKRTTLDLCMSQELCLYEVAGLHYHEKLTQTQLSQFSSADSTGCLAAGRGNRPTHPLTRHRSSNQSRVTPGSA